MRFIETIKVKDGRFFQADYHLRRMRATAMHFFGTSPDLPLDERLLPTGGLLCYRVEYGAVVEGISVAPYFFREMRSLKLVDAAGAEYAYKSADRGELDALYALRGSCDDVLIVSDGLITDTSSANAVFSDGRHLYTPAAPLLRGTKRERLLAEGVIREKNIRVSDLPFFERVYLINALIDLEDDVSVSVSEIAY